MSDAEEAFLLTLDALVSGMEGQNVLAARISELIAEARDRPTPEPVVNVAAPAVTVEAARVTLPERQTLVVVALPPRTVRVNRDRQGRITSLDIE